jgi:hypothetical protein
MKTARERAEEKREEKLALVREQVASGSLVIRQMTDEERRLYPPRPDARKSRDGRIRPAALAKAAREGARTRANQSPA